jgi:hypothetical protein
MHSPFARLRPPHTLVLLAALALVSTACSLLPGQLVAPPGLTDDVGIPYPDGCAAFGLTKRQCEHIVDRIGDSLHVDRSQVREIRLLGDPGCEAEDGSHVICVRTTELRVRVRFIRADDRLLEGSQFCGVGGQNDLGCTDPPTALLFAPTLSGYTDIPCSGDPPDGCASPVPTIDPAVAKDAKSLTIATRDVPLDHVGHYDIPLGTAVLPNGVLTEGSFALADDAQTDYLLTDSVVRLEVTGPDGKAIFNVYEQGWRPGTETVDVHLVFDVESLDSPATLGVRDVVVR